MKISAKFLTAGDNLASVVNDINSAQWDAANEMGEYSVDGLEYYLQQADTLFVVCYVSLESGDRFAGIASGRILTKPYDRMRWLYIDEVDTVANLRKCGVGSTMMNLLLNYASEHELEEVWLGTEAENMPARKLYESLKPDYIDSVVGFTFELD